MIVDASGCLEYSEYLEYLSVINGYLHVVIHRSFDPLSGELFSPNSFFLETNYSRQPYAFLDFIRFHDDKT